MRSSDINKSLCSIENEIITHEDYHVFPGTTLTVCALTLKNGHIVVGESRGLDDRQFDPMVAKRLAKDNAVQKILPLIAYAAREKLCNVNLLDVAAIVDTVAIDVMPHTSDMNTVEDIRDRLSTALIKKFISAQH